jgi:hypothetical protein
VTETTPVRNDALTRATALANRAKELRRAQTEVQDLTAREVQVLARTAASFFDTIPLDELTSALLPKSDREVRKLRHRILQRTIQHFDGGTIIRALLLGRDGKLRLFSARSEDSRDLLLIMEPGRTLPAGVVREVVEWTPALRVTGFRPFDILDRLSTALDSVEEQISDAEHRVQVQKAALASGDLSVLLPTVKKTDRDERAASKPQLLAAPQPQIAAPRKSEARVEPERAATDIFSAVESIARRDAMNAGASEALDAASGETIDGDVEPSPEIVSRATADDAGEWGEPASPERTTEPRQTSRTPGPAPRFPFPPPR